MRVALLILLGLAIGVVGTANVMSLLAQRNPMPTAIMHTMDYHMAGLKQAVNSQHCDATQTARHLLRLQSTATDILPVFGNHEKNFVDFANQLQSRLQQVSLANPATCAALAAALQPVNETCDDCHRQYR